jgi:NADPH:quinone reductase-like Zn-dependent oxidoreductase
MKQWIIPADSNDPRSLTLREVPVPEPGPGEVRLRVRALSINGRDQMILAGPFGRLPGQDLVPLSDVAGDIDALGDGVTEFSLGESVTDLHFAGWESGPPPMELPLGAGSLDVPGMLSEYVVLPSAQVTRAPANLDSAEASTIPVAGVTAWNALNGHHPVSEGQTVLSIGTGGVATYAMQLAQAAGARYFGVIRRDAAGRQLVSAGAAGFVTSGGDGHWAAAVRELTGGGVDRVVDTVGTGTLNESLAAVRGLGEVALVGLFSLAPQPLDTMTLIGAGASVRGIAVGSTTMHRDLVRAIEKHDLHPIIDSRFDFDAAPVAFSKHYEGGVFGKVVIDVA